MELKLKKRPTSPIIIEGFPGLGFVGTIAVEYLIEHLQAERIGQIESKKISPVAAIHNQQIMAPLGIFYAKKYNIVLVHALSNIAGLEWDLAEIIAQLAKQVKAKEIISLEGVSSPQPSEGTGLQSFFYTTKPNKKLTSLEASELKEGIVMGVSGALLLKDKTTPITCIFSETKSSLPDSRAAANVIQVIDQYLGLKVDYKPLERKADEFEAKLKGLITQTKRAVDQKQKKDLDYFG